MRKTLLVVGTVAVIAISFFIVFLRSNATLYTGRIAKKTRLNAINTLVAWQKTIREAEKQMAVFSPRFQKFIRELSQKNTRYLKNFAANSSAGQKTLMHEMEDESLRSDVMFVRKILGLPAGLAKMRSQLDTLYKSQTTPAFLLDDLRERLDDVEFLYKKGEIESVLIHSARMQKKELAALHAASKSGKEELRRLFFQIENILPSPRYIQIFTNEVPIQAEYRAPTVAPSNVGNIELERSLLLTLCVPAWDEDMRQLQNDDELRAVLERVAQYYREVSNGRLSLSYEVVHAPNILIEEGQEGEDSQMLARLCDPVVDYRRTDVLGIFPSRASVDSDFISNDWVATDEGEKFLLGLHMGHFDSASRQVIVPLEYETLVHELGHDIGFLGPRRLSLPHANFAECGGVIYSHEQGVCTNVEYGDPYDPMGGRISGNLSHMSGWTKYLAGWTRPVTVTQDGDYEIDLLEQPTDGAHVLRIPLANFPLCVDFRRPLGFDAAFSQDALAALPPPHNWGGIPREGGVSLYRCPFNSYSDLTVRLDPTPHSPGVTKEEIEQFPQYNFIQDANDSFLTPETESRDNALGFAMRWSAVDENTARIHVDIDETKLDSRRDLGLIWERCNGDRLDVRISNQSEIHVQGTLTLRVEGTRASDDKNELIREEVLEVSLAPGGLLPFAIADAQTYREIRMVIVPDDVIGDADLENNSIRFITSQFCI